MEISIKGYSKIIANIKVDDKLFSGLHVNHTLRMSVTELFDASVYSAESMLYILNTGDYFRYTPRTRLLKGINEHYLLLTHTKITLISESEIKQLHNALRDYRNKYV